MLGSSQEDTQLPLRLFLWLIGINERGAHCHQDYERVSSMEGALKGLLLLLRY